MFGSNRAGLVDSICDPAHQRPPANSRGSSAMGAAGSVGMGSSLGRPKTAWETGRVVVGLTGQLVSDDRSHHPWTLACTVAAR
jgi:hypothetical protein